MITNYYTLRAVVEEWRSMFEGFALEHAFSQAKGELSLAFARPTREMTLRLSMRTPFQYVFRSDGFSRARRNVAEVFGEAHGRLVTAVRLAHRDRMIFIELSGDMAFQIMMFGPRANTFLVAPEGTIHEAFLRNTVLKGGEPPAPRAAPYVANFEEFRKRWSAQRNSVKHALASTVPLFDHTLAREAALRAGVDPDGTPKQSENVLERIYGSVADVEEAVMRPRPIVYWEGREPIQFSLLPLSDIRGTREEQFDTVDEAVRVFVRHALARAHYRQLRDPLEKALSTSVEQQRKRVREIATELSSESRADHYERIAHLLMADPAAIVPGQKVAVLKDLFSEDQPLIEASVDPSVNAVENAERYYERSRRARRSRGEASKRLDELKAQLSHTEALHHELREIESLKDLRTFRRERADDLMPYLPATDGSYQNVPFRRFDVGSGYEVWVGRNARQNDDLTFRHARKFDLWLHARGVPGSHAVLRVPGRSAQPDRKILLRAAAIAAYFSKARGSALVPVIVVERKYVRKPRGAEMGIVKVDREEVILVEPGLPT